MRTRFVKGRNNRLGDTEYVESSLRKMLPYTFRNVVYRIVENKPMGFFRHLYVEYAMSDTETNGPKQE